MLGVITKSKSKIFFILCFSFLLGTGFISILDKKIDFVYLYLALFISISFLIINWKNKNKRLILLCLALFILGITRYSLAFPFTKNHISNKNGTKQTITGFISTEPDIRSDGVRYILTGKGDTKGKIYFKAPLYPRYSYGDKLEVKCSLRAPEPIEDVKNKSQKEFRYDLFLARYHVFSLCQQASIKKLEGQDGSALLRNILGVKEVVADRINKLWHEPHASFMAGLLYGYRGGLGNLNELFSRTSVTHIVAISGYNITIIATILITLCTQLLIPRKKAFWLVVLGIIIFVIFAGASASVVRAGIMGVIVLLAKEVGRISKIANVMILTAVIMTIHNPFILIWDAGFQLSFISTLGLVYLTPLVRKPFEWVPVTFGIKESLISTLAAIIATLPLILYQFGRLSIVAPIVNILILWIIPFIMLLGFFAVISSFLFLPLANVISWIAWLGLSFIIEIVKWFANLSFAAVDMRIPLWLMLFLYITMLYFIKKSVNVGSIR